MLPLTASIYNILSPLIDVFEAVLKFFHNSLGVPWGWAIVLLTLCVRACLVPLTVKQMGSMARMQQLQPELKAIQNKYKEDKQRQQQEMMKFYKENNVNPLGSCLPMVAQLPVFISLYYMLRQSLRTDICPAIQKQYQAHYAAVHHISLAAASGQTTACGPNGGASFLFIPDLTNKATGVDADRPHPALRRDPAGFQPDDVQRDDGPDAAADHAVHAADLRAVRHPVPGRRARLLDHHQPLDDRPAVRRQAADRPDPRRGDGAPAGAAAVVSSDTARTTGGRGSRRSPPAKAAKAAETEEAKAAPNGSQRWRAGLV